MATASAGGTTAWNLLTDPTVLSSIGSAIGGFIAVFVFFVIRRIWAKRDARPELKQTLYCANYLNKGGDHEMAGEIQHICGGIISLDEARKVFGTTHELWEYATRFVPVKGDNRSNIFYGPYLSISEPGLYIAKFRIRALGLPKVEEVSEDYILLELDVSKKLPAFVATQQGIGTVKFDTQMHRQYIRFSQLATGNWTTFELPFYADGLGEWEFRAFAFNGHDTRRDNFGFLGKHARLAFESVQLWRQKDKKLPDS